jgi:hypothetical protein
MLAALSRCGFPKNGRNRTHPGQLPFGYDYQNYRLVENQAFGRLSSFVNAGH